MAIIYVVPRYFNEMVIVATVIIVFYVAWKPFFKIVLTPSMTRLLGRSRILGFVDNAISLISFAGDLLFAGALAFVGWVILTYSYSAPLELMKAYTASVDHQLTLCSVLIGGSVAFLGLIVAAASVLSSKDRLPSRFSFWTKWMTRFSLASVTLAFGSLLVRTNPPSPPSNLPSFLLGVSSLCFLGEIYLTLPAMRLLANMPLASTEPQQISLSRKVVVKTAVQAVGFTLLVLGLLLFVWSLGPPF